MTEEEFVAGFHNIYRPSIPAAEWARAFAEHDRSTVRHRSSLSGWQFLVNDQSGIDSGRSWKTLLECQKQIEIMIQNLELDGLRDKAKTGLLTVIRTAYCSLAGLGCCTHLLNLVAALICNTHWLHHLQTCLLIESCGCRRINRSCWTNLNSSN